MNVLKPISILLLTGMVVCNVLSATKFSQPKSITRLNVAPIPVIFDSDMGNDVDDVLALDILYKNHESKTINLLAITSNKDAEHSTAFIDIMNNYYGFPNIPIGKIVKGAVCTREKEYSLMVASDSTWKRTYKNQDQLLESHKLMRKALAGQKNHSVVIISVGFLSNLSRLLQSGPDEFSPLNGKDLVALKVKYMSLMGGEFEENDTKTAYDNAIRNGIAVAVPNKAVPKKKRTEYNIRYDNTASQNVFINWPTEIIVSPFEVGKHILYPGSSIQKDFKFTAKNPLVKAYEAYAPMPYDRPTWDPTAVLYVVEPQWFSLSQKGHVLVTDEAYTYFLPCVKGNCRYLKTSVEQQKAIVNRFLEIIPRKPAAL